MSKCAQDFWDTLYFSTKTTYAVRHDVEAV